MSLATSVYISTNHLTDARYCAAMGVEFIEFILDKTIPDAISKETFLGISQWIEGIKYVAYFESEEGVEEICNTLNIEHVASNNISLLNDLPDSFTKFYKTTLDTINREEFQNIDYINIEGGSDMLSKQETESIKKLAATKNIILAYGFDDTNVSNIITTGIKGIGIKGGEEERPGYKDMDKLADILEAIEVD